MLKLLKRVFMAAYDELFPDTVSKRHLDDECLAMYRSACKLRQMAGFEEYEAQMQTEKVHLISLTNNLISDVYAYHRKKLENATNVPKQEQET